MNNNPELNQNFNSPTPSVPYWDKGFGDTQYLEKSYLELQKLAQQQQQANFSAYTLNVTNDKLNEIYDKLKLIENSLYTLTNMLKLILTTQIEKETQDKKIDN